MSQMAMESRWAMMPSDAIDDPDLTLSDLRVLGVIGYHSGRKKPAWPKQATIASRLKLSRETVNRSIRRLWRKGYIDIAHQFKDDGGGQRESYYFMRLDPDPEVQPVEVKVRGKLLKLETRVTQPSHREKSQRGVTSADVHGVIAGDVHGVTSDVTARRTSNRTSHKNITPNPKGNGKAGKDSEPKRSIPAPIKAEFDQLWQLWPAKGRERSKGKDLCLQVFAKACDKAPAPHIVEAAAAFLAKSDPRYAPGLDRWLRDGRFEHFLPATTVTPAQGSLPLEPAKPASAPPCDDWGAAVSKFVRSGIWPDRLGDRPDEFGYAGTLAAIEAVMATGSFGFANPAGLKANIDRLRAERAA